MSETEAARGAPGLPMVVGHSDLMERIREAISSGRMPQSLLLHGPPGVGKRTLALWIAALLQCEEPDAPCGACRSCRLAARLEHPDTHYHFPMPRPKRASTRKKLREMLEAARMERLARLREDPGQPLDDGEVTGIYLAAVEEIRAQATRRPAMGSTSVFIIGEADRMVSQGANPEAANAFLKLLEEPPAYAYLILTSSRPGALLPTIRSRTNSLRLAPLRDDTVATHLMDSLDLTRETADAVARRAEGSIGRALALVEGHGSEAQEQADRLLRAVVRGSHGQRLQAAVAFTARGARSQLAAVLDALEGRLRDLLCLASGADRNALDAEAVRDLLSGSLDPAGVQRSLEILEEAREAAYRNVNPQATITLLLTDVASALGGQAADPGAAL